MKLRILIFVVLQLSCFYGYADNLKKFIEIKCDFQNGALNGQTLKFAYFDLYTRRGAKHVFDEKEFVVESDSLKTEIRMSSNFGYINISLPQKFDGDNISSYTFLVQSGDKITLKLLGDKIVFSGKDSIKLICQQKIAKIISQFNNDYTDSDPDFFEKYAADNNSALLSQLAFLDGLKTNFDPKFFNILKCDVQFKSFLTTAVALNYPTVDEDSLKLERRIDFLLKYFDEKSRIQVDPIAVKYSYAFVDFLFVKEGFHNSIDRKKMSDRVQMFSGLYNGIIARYKSEIRDKLIILALTADLSYRDNKDKYVNTSLGIVKNRTCRRILYELKTTDMKGAAAFNFQLQDTTGKSMSLTDMKGNVLIVDFYFTGCSGCAALTKAMKPVLDSLKGLSNVKFVSVNVDRTLSMFKAAVNSGIYTHKESINLYTCGKGMDNEFIKYYNIQSMPSIMIIDKNGRIVSRDPPRPNISDPLTIKAFVRLVKSAS